MHCEAHCQTLANTGSAEKGGGKWEAEAVCGSLCSRCTVSGSRGTGSHQACCSVPLIPVLVKQRLMSLRLWEPRSKEQKGKRRGWEGRKEAGREEKIVGLLDLGTWKRLVGFMWMERRAFQVPCVAEAEPALHPGTSYQQVDTPTMQEQTSPPVLSVIASYFKCRGCGLISATTISLNCISSFAISVTWRQNICLRDKSHQYLLTFRLDLLSLSYTIYSVNKSPCQNLPFAH